MKPIVIHSEIYRCNLVVIGTPRFISCLSKFMAKSIIINLLEPYSLPNLHAIFLSFAPMWVGTAIESEIKNFISDNSNIHLEGFITFRLCHIRHKLCAEIHQTLALAVSHANTP